MPVAVAATPAVLTASNAPSIAVDAPGGSERIIAEVWSSLLGIDGISASDNFFDLGGHSLLAMKVIDEIEARKGVRMNVRSLIFETLGRVAAELDRALAEKASAQQPAPPPAQTPPAVADEKPGFLKRLFGKGS
jgi:acyl carrier protein